MSQEQLFDLPMPVPAFEVPIPDQCYQSYQVTDEDKELILAAGLAVKTRWDAMLVALDESGITGKMKQSIFADDFYSKKYPGVIRMNDHDFVDRGMTTQDDGSVACVVNPWTLTRFGSEGAQKDVLLQLKVKDPWAAQDAETFCQTYLDQEDGERFLQATAEFSEALYRAEFIATDDILLWPLRAYGSDVVSLVLPDNKQALTDWRKFIMAADLTNAIIGENGYVMTDTTQACVRFVCDVALGYRRTGEFYDAAAVGDIRYDEDGDFADYGPDAVFFKEVRRQRVLREAAKVGGEEAMKE